MGNVRNVERGKVGLGIARVGGNGGWKLWDEKGRGWWDGEKGIRRLREREVRGTTGGKWGMLDLVVGISREGWEREGRRKWECREG